MAGNFVQLYKSTDLNAPVLTGQVGSLITLLNKCLVDGYTPASVTGIVESGTNYTVTLGAANVTLGPAAGQYLTIAGASPAGMNGTWRINTYTDSTHVILTGPGGLGTITGGAITYAKAGLGWSRPFAAGTNSQTYISTQTTGVLSETYTPRYLQVIDNGATAGGAKEAQLMGYEAMTADQTGTGLYPTVIQAANGVCARKSLTADGTARAWTLYGNGLYFGLVPITGDAASQQNPSIRFGYIVPWHTGDAYNTVVGGGVLFNTAATTSSCNLQILAGAIGATGMYLPRLYNQLGTSIVVQNVGLSGGTANTTPGGASMPLTYPLPSNNGVVVGTNFVMDLAGNIRGRMLGEAYPLAPNPFLLYDESTNVSGFSGATMTTVLVTSGGGVGTYMIDRYGPWT